MNRYFYCPCLAAGLPNNVERRPRAIARRDFLSMCSCSCMCKCVCMCLFACVCVCVCVYVCLVFMCACACIVLNVTRVGVLVPMPRRWENHARYLGAASGNLRSRKHFRKAEW